MRYAAPSVYDHQYQTYRHNVRNVIHNVKATNQA